MINTIASFAPSMALYVALNPEYWLRRDVNMTWTEFPTEYTGGGRDWPQTMNGWSLLFVATFVTVTRAPGA